MVIGFCGKMGAGKDTYGNYLKSIYPNAIKYSFAGPIREELTLLINNIDDKDINKRLNIDNEIIQEVISIFGSKKALKKANVEIKTREVRRLLQYWGEMRRDKNPDYWVNIARIRIQEYQDKGYLVYVTDVRRINEINLIKELNGTLVLLTADEKTRRLRIGVRDGQVPTKESMRHQSEIELDNYKDFDMCIDTEKVLIKDIYKEIDKILNLSIDKISS